MANFLYEIHLQGIVVVVHVFIILDWMFVLVNTTTTISLVAPSHKGTVEEFFNKKVGFCFRAFNIFIL